MSSLLVVLMLGVALSAPFLVQDGGARVFATTWPITALQVAVGALVLVRALARLAVGGLQASADGSGTALASISAVVWLALVVAPLLPIGRVAALAPVRPPSCAPGEFGAVVRLGRESYLLTKQPEGDPVDRLRFQLSSRELERATAGTWYQEGFEHLPQGWSVVHGYQLAAETAVGAQFGADLRLVVEQDLGDKVYQTARFCVDRGLVQTVTDVPYYTARLVPK